MRVPGGKRAVMGSRNPNGPLGAVTFRPKRVTVSGLSRGDRRYRTTASEEATTASEEAAQSAEAGLCARENPPFESDEPALDEIGAYGFGDASGNCLLVERPATECIGGSEIGHQRACQALRIVVAGVTGKIRGADCAS